MSVNIGFYNLLFAEQVGPHWMNGSVAMPIVGLTENRRPAGEILLSAQIDDRTFPLIVRNGDSLSYCFDYYRTFLRVFEEGFVSTRPFTSRLPVNVRTLAPRVLRGSIKRLHQKLSGLQQSNRFPQWPIEGSIMAIRHLLLSCGLLQPIVWPASKKYAVCVTHDIDSAEGFRNIPFLHSLARKKRIPLTWYLVAHDYPIDRCLVQELSAAGDEIASHGYTHDNRTAFLPEAQMISRLRSVADTFGELTDSRVGFRSPSLYMTPALRRVVGQYCSYDSSCVDTGLLSPEPRNRGCGYLLPFKLDDLVHVPITVPLESSLIFQDMTAGEMVEIWEKKIEFIKQTGSVAVICTHPEPHLLMQNEFLTAYQSFLTRLTSDGDAYFCTVKDLVALYLGQRSAKPVDMLPEGPDSIIGRSERELV